MHGIIEGFYGRPWSWEERHAVAAALAAHGMDTYVYAPKDDPLHRERWREPYVDADLERFAALAAGELDLGLAISPGLSMDPWSASDRRALLGKVDQMVATGIRLVGLLFDDIEPFDGAGRAHGAVGAWLRDHLDDAVDLFVVPLHYTGTSPVPYLHEMGAALPEEVDIGWTGPLVVNDTITVDDARTWSRANAGRRPLLWDNTPVNDALMSAHLFSGPLRGREPGLPRELAGYLANPMVQARASLPALASAAAWLRGDDPGSAWEDAAGDDLVLLEGCDGRRVAAMAGAALGPGGSAALAELDDWFARAEVCDEGSLGDAVAPWVHQLRSEAAVGRVACGLLAEEDTAAMARGAGLLHVMWPAIRCSELQVLGGRGSLRAAFGQDEQSRWFASGASWRAPANVVDRLVAEVFARLGAAEERR